MGENPPSLKIALVADILSKRSGEDPVKIMTDFYRSKTYAMLQFFFFTPQITVFLLYYPHRKSRRKSRHRLKKTETRRGTLRGRSFQERREPPLKTGNFGLGNTSTLATFKRRLPQSLLTGKAAPPPDAPHS